MFCTARSARSGPEVTFIPSHADAALETSDEWVEKLLDEGWEPRDIALLTFGTRHPVQVERQESVGQRDYWQEYWNDEIFYGHVLGFKGLERRAVVLCVNIDGHYDHAAERLYVGLSRATDRLVVIGDPTTIREIGGDVVAHRLGI